MQVRNFWINRERSLDMKVKISEYTPYLLVGLLIVVIARLSPRSGSRRRKLI